MQNPQQRRHRQHLVVVREDWSVICFDHELVKVWKETLEHTGSPAEGESFIVDQVSKGRHGTVPVSVQCQCSARTVPVQCQYSARTVLVQCQHSSASTAVSVQQCRYSSADTSMRVQQCPSNSTMPVQCQNSTGTVPVQCQYSVSTVSEQCQNSTGVMSVQQFRYSSAGTTVPVQQCR